MQSEFKDAREDFRWYFGDEGVKCEDLGFAEAKGAHLCFQFGETSVDVHDILWRWSRVTVMRVVSKHKFVKAMLF